MLIGGAEVFHGVNQPSLNADLNESGDESGDDLNYSKCRGEYCSLMGSRTDEPVKVARGGIFI
jgi:hypothetical protein